MDTIPIGSDAYVPLYGVRDSATGDYLNSGTATYELFTAAGVAVPSGTGSLTYVDDSDGDYLGVVESTVTGTLTPGAVYYADVEFEEDDFNYTTRVWFTTQLPGGVLIDPAAWMDATGNNPTGAELTSLTKWTAGVRAALLRRLKPYLPEAQTLTMIVDAPPSNTLVLPVRPIRSITSVHVNWYANGDPAAFTADNLLTAYQDYYSQTEPVDGFNRTGILYRRNRSLWGWERTYSYNALAPTLTPGLGAVKVVAECGELVVPDDIQAAAILAVTKAMGSRKFGAQVGSASLNGASYSLPSQALAEGFLNDPSILALLRPYMTPRFA